MPRLRIAHVWPAAVAAALALAGCANEGGIGGALAPGPLAYKHSNAVAPSGYSESLIGPDRYRIEVKGPLNTPRERLEKIAATRAAEIGKDNRLKYFKIESVQHTTRCDTVTPGPKAPGSNTAARTVGYAVMTADVAFTKTPSDTTYLESRPTFAQYRAELDQDQAPPPPADPATAAQCG